jgi:hypothetical protein
MISDGLDIPCSAASLNLEGMARLLRWLGYYFTAEKLARMDPITREIMYSRCIHKPRHDGV